MSHKYYLLNRPPGPGCQPDNATNEKTWYPKQAPPEFPRGAWGWVSYPEPLPFNQISQFELYPQCPLEQACYIAWQDCSQSAQATTDYLAEYWQAPEAELIKLVSQDDFTAGDVQQAKAAGYTWSQATRLIEAKGG